MISPGVVRLGRSCDGAAFFVRFEAKNYKEASSAWTAALIIREVGRRPVDLFTVGVLDTEQCQVVPADKLALEQNWPNWYSLILSKP